MNSQTATLTGTEIAVSFNFEVRSVEDGEVGNFQSVEGIERTVEPYEHKEGGRNGMVHYFVGQAQYSEMTLRWGWMHLDWLHDWANSVRFGKAFRKTLIITQLDRAMQPVRVYTVVGAWPVAWSAAKLDAGSSDPPIEEVKLKYQRLEFEVVPQGPARRRS